MSTTSLSFQSTTSMTGSMTGSMTSINSRQSTTQNQFCNVSLKTARGKQLILIKVIILSILPIIVLVVQNAYFLYESVKQVNEIKLVDKDVTFMMSIGEVIHCLQIERGVTVEYASTDGSVEIYATLIQKHHPDTNSKLLGIENWFHNPKKSYLKSKTELYKYIQEERAKLVPFDKTNTFESVLKFYSDIIHEMFNNMQSDFTETSPGDLWNELVGFMMLVSAKEQEGQTRAYGAAYFSIGHFTLAQQLMMETHSTLALSFMEKSRIFSSVVDTNMAKFESTNTSKDIEFYLEIIKTNSNVTGLGYGKSWFSNMTYYMNFIKDTELKLASVLKSSMKTKISDIYREESVSVVLMITAILFFPIIIFSVLRIMKTVTEFAEKLEENTAVLKIERKKTVGLLYEMLPQVVAKKLLNNEPIPPEQFNAVTIFFSDVVGFTDICSRSTPFEVVNMLNTMYEAFDHRLSIYDCYKVETIGDAYMVVSGLPKKNGDRHAAEIAKLSYDLITTISFLQIAHLGEQRLKMRIGLNSGPCVAGVVGVRMPRYCLFGDTVNTASRMESNGIENKIHLSENTYYELKYNKQFVMEPRGKIPIKGKGEVMTYWLIKVLNTRPADADDKNLSAFLKKKI